MISGTRCASCFLLTGDASMRRALETTVPRRDVMGWRLIGLVRHRSRRGRCVRVSPALWYDLGWSERTFWRVLARVRRHLHATRLYDDLRCCWFTLLALRRSEVSVTAPDGRDRRYGSRVRRNAVVMSASALSDLLFDPAGSGRWSDVVRKANAATLTYLSATATKARVLPDIMASLAGGRPAAGRGGGPSKARPKRSAEWVGLAVAYRRASATWSWAPQAGLCIHWLHRLRGHGWALAPLLRALERGAIWAWGAYQAAKAGMGTVARRGMGLVTPPDPLVALAEAERILGIREARRW